MPRGFEPTEKRSEQNWRRGNTIMEGFSLYPEDRRLLIALMRYYGCSKSETFRTIVRAHAAQVGVK